MVMKMGDHEHKTIRVLPPNDEHLRDYDLHVCACGYSTFHYNDQYALARKTDPLKCDRIACNNETSADKLYCSRACYFVMQEHVRAARGMPISVTQFIKETMQPRLRELKSVWPFSIRIDNERTADYHNYCHLQRDIEIVKQRMVCISEGGNEVLKDAMKFVALCNDTWEIKP